MPPHPPPAHVPQRREPDSAVLKANIVRVTYRQVTVANQPAVQLHKRLLLILEASPLYRTAWQCSVGLCG